MSWLVGSTDITNFAADIYAILTGAAPTGQRGAGQAANGVTCASGDQWTGIDSTNHVIRSQATETSFYGEYHMWRGMPRFAARNTGAVLTPAATREAGKPTFSGAYSGGTARCYFAAYVSVVNTAAGNLSGTQVTWTLVNADSGATVTSGTATGWTGSSFTVLLAQGISLTLTLGGSDSFVAGTNAIMWFRAYTTTYTQGIDYFPEAARIKNATVLSTTSGGANAYTLASDYEIAQEGHTHPQSGSTSIGYTRWERDWGGNGAGCGIHWKTTGAPPAAGTVYYASGSAIYGCYYHLSNVLSISANYSLCGGPMEFWDPVTSVARHPFASSQNKTTLNTTLAHAQLFAGASQAGSVFINYWISCKSDKIVFVYQGDPGNSGRTVVFSIQRATPIVTADKHPWFFATNGAVPSALVMSKYNYDQGYWGDQLLNLNQIDNPCWYTDSTNNAKGYCRLTGITDDTGHSGYMPNQNPNNWDSRWWLYTIYLANKQGGMNSGGTFDGTKAGGLRSKLRGLYALAPDNFSNLDNLVDGSSTYLLVVPTSTFGGIEGQVYHAVAVFQE